MKISSDDISSFNHINLKAMFIITETWFDEVVAHSEKKTFWLNYSAEIFLHLFNFRPLELLWKQKECTTLQLKPCVLILFSVLSEEWTLSYSMQCSLYYSTAIQFLMFTSFLCSKSFILDVFHNYLRFETSWRPRCEVKISFTIIILKGPVALSSFFCTKGFHQKQLLRAGLAKSFMWDS